METSKFDYLYAAITSLLFLGLCVILLITSAYAQMELPLNDGGKLALNKQVCFQHVPGTGVVAYTQFQRQDSQGDPVVPQGCHIDKFSPTCDASWTLTSQAVTQLKSFLTTNVCGVYASWNIPNSLCQ